MMGRIGGAYWFAEIFCFGGIFGCELGCSCGFNCLARNRLADGIKGGVLAIVSYQEVEGQSEEVNGLTQAGQMPVTDIPVFASLLKSMACRYLAFSSRSLKDGE